MSECRESRTLSGVVGLRLPGTEDTWRAADSRSSGPCSRGKTQGALERAVSSGANGG